MSLHNVYLSKVGLESFPDADIQALVRYYYLPKTSHDDTLWLLALQIISDTQHAQMPNLEDSSLVPFIFGLLSQEWEVRLDYMESKADFKNLSFYPLPDDYEEEYYNSYYNTIIQKDSDSFIYRVEDLPTPENSYDINVTRDQVVDLILLSLESLDRFQQQLLADPSLAEVNQHVLKGEVFLRINNPERNQQWTWNLCNLNGQRACMEEISRAKKILQQKRAKPLHSLADCTRAVADLRERYPDKRCPELNKEDLLHAAGICGIPEPLKMTVQQLCQAIVAQSGSRLGKLPPELIEAIAQKLGK